MAEIDDVMSAVKELRNEVEKKSADQEKINKLQSALDASEKKNQELVKKQAELENAQREIAAKQEEIEKLAKASGDNSERIKELEKEIALHSAAPAGASDAWKNSEEHIAFKEYFLNGIGAKTMRTDTDVQGGYLVHPEFAADILRQLHDVSPIRSFARVRTTSKKDLTMGCSMGWSCCRQ
jgi:HK97 family phage major capsid protein